jgi:signal peptidase
VSARRVGRWFLDGIALAMIALAVVMFSGRIAVQPVLSGSMTGYADRGDLLVGVDTRDLHVGDVILFAPPAPYETPGNRPVAHRIHSIKLVDGTPVATTKGDANPEPDPWTLDLSRTRTAQVRAVVPDAGWPFIRLRLLTTPAGRMATGLGLMAAGGLMLVVGRNRHQRSDEAWPPAFEGEALEARLRLVQQRHSGSDGLPGPRFGPVPCAPVTVAQRPLIPRQRSRVWSRVETIVHFPID